MLKASKHVLVASTGCLELQEVSNVYLKVPEAYLELQEATSAYLVLLEASSVCRRQAVSM